MEDGVILKIKTLVNLKSISDLVNGLKDILCLLEIKNTNNDDICLALSQAVEEKISSFEYDNKYEHFNNGLYILDETQSPLFLLNSYIIGIIETDEMIESISDFINNCAGYVDADITEPINMETIEKIIEDSEEKCGFVNYITSEQPMFILPFNNYYVENPYDIRALGNTSLLSVFRLQENTELQMQINFGNAFGNILYDTLEKQVGARYIAKELRIYIPEARKYRTIDDKKLFGRYFVKMLCLKKQKPQVQKYDKVRNDAIICVEFFKKIIKMRL